jgi:hypothetical protein
MQSHSLVYPMFAMVILTAATLGRLFAGRVAAVRAGTADARYFKTYQEGDEPTATAQLSRNFINLFEAPTLFYSACLAAMVAAPPSNVVFALAWLYVVFRVVHTWIHTSSNTLNHRIAAYFCSWVVLVALWVAVVFGIATRS